MRQAVDAAVSKRKFQREVDEYRELEADYRRRGWMLVRAAFPDLLVVLAAPQLKPAAIVMGVRFDYTDYDLRPPSVQLVDPFNEEPYTGSSLPTVLKRTVESGAPLPPGLALPPGAQAKFVAHQPLMQAYGPNDIPFLCLAGVREYHDHPGHSGDAWELHRHTGAGRFVRLLEVITRYGIEPISDFNISLVLQVAGFHQTDPPA